MKTLALITLIVVIETSLGWHRGKEPNRKLAAPWYGNVGHHFVTNSNGGGPGSNGKDYDAYQREDDPSVDELWSFVEQILANCEKWI